MWTNFWVWEIPLYCHRKFAMSVKGLWLTSIGKIMCPSERYTLWLVWWSNYSEVSSKLRFCRLGLMPRLTNQKFECGWHFLNIWKCNFLFIQHKALHAPSWLAEWRIRNKRYVYGCKWIFGPQSCYILMWLHSPGICDWLCSVVMLCHNNFF